MTGVFELVILNSVARNVGTVKTQGVNKHLGSVNQRDFSVL